MKEMMDDEARDRRMNAPLWETNSKQTGVAGGEEEREMSTHSNTTAIHVGKVGQAKLDKSDHA
jgi:hypothetical protein